MYYLSLFLIAVLPRAAVSDKGGPRETKASHNNLQGGKSNVVSQARNLVTGTCDNGNRGNGICANNALCCSKWGWCGTGSLYCGGNPVPSPTTKPVAKVPTRSPTKKPVAKVPTRSPTKKPVAKVPTLSPTKKPVQVSPTPPGACPAGWAQASWTTYTSYATCCPASPNYDPNADTTECTDYSACDYLGDFAYIGHQSFAYVKSNNLVAFFSVKNNASYGGKRIRISAKGKTLEALVADTCGDNDCGGCCTANARPSGNLVDMEYWTVVNNFGDISAADGQLCWQLV